MKRASEVVEQLISLAFDNDPEETDLTLAECLRLYAALVAGEAVSDAMDAGGAEARPPSAASLAAQQIYEKDRDDDVIGLIDPDAVDVEEAGAEAPDTHTHTHTHTRRDPLRAKESCRTSWGAGLRRSAECSSGSRITESGAVWVPSPSWRKRQTAPLPPS